MPKPTHASVTDVPCTCDYLQNAAMDEDNPIVFDERTSEYHFTYQEPGLVGLSTMVIFHCPFCGGTVPKSKRSLVFAPISRSEEERLFKLLSPIETIDEALEKLGKPDYDGYMGTHSRERDGEPRIVERHRQIRYENLSETAEVRITERPDGKVAFRLLGKEIGK